MKPFKLTLVLIFFFVSLGSYAQQPLEHGFGFNVGFYQLRSDYGERFDAETNNKNSGTTFALSYYLNRASRRSANYFMEHVKYRIDLLFSSADLEHYGEWADDPRLEAMTGSFNNIGLSTGIEYYPFGILLQVYDGRREFFEVVSPYAGVATGLNYVSPDASSSLEGGLSNPENIFPTFIPRDVDDGLNLDDRLVLSLNLRLGIRFNLGLRDAVMIESSWMLFGSDLVDGLKPIGPQNKYTDWSWGVNVGYSRFLF